MSEYVSENLNILLETAQSKHETILSNIRSLDIKASIILAFFGVLLIPYFDISQWIIKKDGFIFLKFIPGLFVIIGIILCLIALFPQKSLTYPKLSFLENMYLNKIMPNNFKAELFSYYKESCRQNNKISVKKLKFLNLALIFLIISFAVVILLFIFKGDINV